MSRPKMRWSAVVVVAASVAVGSFSSATAKAPVTAERFMVSAANPLAAKAGYDVLEAGGSAVDAAIAVQLMLALVEPQSSGIGGGATMLYWDAKARTLHGFDGRETAPASAKPSRFLKPDGTKLPYLGAVIGGQSVGVPGVLRLLEVAHKLFGKKPWADSFQSAIALAEQGFRVSPRLAGFIVRMRDRGLERFAETKTYFFAPDGAPLAEGALLKNPAYAETLRTIARDGADAFYTGPIARDIVTAVDATSIRPNNITLEDLRDYRVKLRPPLCVAYRAYRVCSSAPPTSGGITVGQILGILDQFDIRAIGWTAEFAHLFAEAAKLAYADRALYMADSDFVPVPARGLLDPAYLAARAALIDRAKSNGPAAAGTPPATAGGPWSPSGDPGGAGTSHFVIRDADGNALSMTTTIESPFGSRVMVRGFLLNNQLTDFDYLPEKDGKPVANRVEGGKRPRSSKSPTIVFKDGAPYLLVGSPGGSRIISYVAQTVIAVLDWDMDPQAAIDQGRLVNRNRGKFALEKGTAAAAFAPALAAKGHTVEVRDLTSGLHAIQIKDGKLTGGADPRREGVALGE